ncbi:hypothetical protein GGP69_002329 [Salinibacter ruber]|nr:hypothetical protein [Salinibacter ruber]
MKETCTATTERTQRDRVPATTFHFRCTFAHGTGKAAVSSVCRDVSSDVYN